MTFIRLSEKHGVNPTLVICFYCNKENGELALLGQLPGDAEAPRKAAIDQVPCGACKKLMEMGVILISVDEAKTEDQRNPYRTGGWVVVRDEFIGRLISNEELRADILKKRVSFITNEIWNAVGLPRVDGKEEGT